ncbi:hypothetical protein PMLGA01_070033600, partial [Plasmodium malariae]
GDIDKSYVSTTVLEKKNNLHDPNFSIEEKNINSKEIKYDFKEDKKKKEAEQKEEKKEKQMEKHNEEQNEQPYGRERQNKKNTFLNANKSSKKNFLDEQTEYMKDIYSKSLHGRIGKKDMSNLLLYNIIYINKMNRKLNNCKFVCFNFKYYHFKKIISDYNKYYKIILETFKRKLCENYYAYTFGNNENGSLAIGKPSYLKLSPTIGSIGYEKNKKSVKKGSDFWFTNNLQLIPIKIKRICMNENMISIIDKKHNLYIGGDNTFIETKNEIYFKDKNEKSKK